jgi:hypothetical protein
MSVLSNSRNKLIISKNWRSRSAAGWRISVARRNKTPTTNLSPKPAHLWPSRNLVDTAEKMHPQTAATSQAALLPRLRELVLVLKTHDSLPHSDPHRHHPRRVLMAKALLVPLVLPEPKNARALQIHATLLTRLVPPAPQPVLSRMALRANRLKDPLQHDCPLLFRLSSL